MLLIEEQSLKKILESKKDELRNNDEIINVEEDLKLHLYYYMIFRDYSDCVINIIEGITKNDLLYNKYYRFVNFKMKYFKINGCDVGIEQQEIRLLDELVQNLEGDIDWKFIEELQNKSTKFEGF